MGVSWVMSYPIPENKSAQQVMESLHKMIDILNAKKCGTFSVDCDTFVASPHIQSAKVLHTFHDTERPKTTFALLDNGQYLLADASNFDLFLQTYLNPVYVCKKTQKIECRGTKFELCDGDFVIRIGAVTFAQQSFKGIIIDIEYRPCMIPFHCWNLISDVAQHFIASSHVQNPSAYLASKMNESFQPIDNIRQYHEVFNALRKQQQRD